MPNVSVYKVERDKTTVLKWAPLVNAIEQNGIEVSTVAKQSDVHIVLCGKYENPVILNGKRVLLYSEHDWMGNMSWKTVYKPVVEEFYDEMHCVDSMSFADIITKIRSYVATC